MKQSIIKRARVLGVNYVWGLFNFTLGVALASFSVTEWLIVTGRCH